MTLRSSAALAAAWQAHAERTAPTPWRTSRSGRPTRRIAGGVTVAVEYDRRRGRYRVRFCGGRGGLWRDTFATLNGAQAAVDRLEARRALRERGVEAWLAS